MGESRDPDRRSHLTDPDRKSFQRHAGAVAAAAENGRTPDRRPRPVRHQGTGRRQARAGDRGGRRAPSPDDRKSRCWQIHAGRAAAVDPAAAVAARTARNFDDRVRRGRTERRRTVHEPPIPRTASFRQHGRADRRRHARAARRNFAGSSWRAVSGRTAGVRCAGAGFAAPAAGERRGRGVARQSSRHLSRALHAGRRHESLPLRTGL